MFKMDFKNDYQDINFDRGTFFDLLSYMGGLIAGLKTVFMILSMPFSAFSLQSKLIREMYFHPKDKSQFAKRDIGIW